MSWLESEKGSTLPEYILRFKADDKFTIRMLDNNRPERVFTHSTRNLRNQFVKFLCVGPKAGCTFCATNKEREVAHAKNKDKPFPTKLDYVKPVYVYEKDAVMLLIGVEVWQQIDFIESVSGNLSDKDIVVQARQQDRLTYFAQAAAVGPFNKQIDKAQASELMTKYTEYLRGNIKSVDNIPQPQVSATASAEPAGAGAAEIEVSGDLKSVQDKLLFMVGDNMDTQALSKCFDKFASGKNKIKDLTIDECNKIIPAYQEMTKAKK